MLEMGMGEFGRTFKVDLWLMVMVLGVCFQAQVLNSQNQSCSSSDLHALLDFNSSLDSGIGEWSNKSGFCSWVGVSCDSRVSSDLEKRVIGLVLGGRRLGRIVSASLACLDQLRYLSLSSNLFRGIVPPDLFLLPQLEVLDLSHNKFSGEIPAVINLPSIRIFNISSNKFNGSLPFLRGSANLFVFNISDNSFSGSVDTGICSTWSWVEVLDLSMNEFSGDFPAGFGNCTSLKRLFLGFNNLSGNLPENLFGLSSLSRLFLQENKFSGHLGDRIGNLSNLMQFDISVNGFTGTIPDVFGKLKKIQHFAAHSNKFTGSLPASLSNCSTLHLLNLRNNSLGGGIYLNCTEMINLTSLDLGSNSFNGSIPNNLSSCRKLRNINLAKNNLVGQIPVSFENLQDLSYLSLSNNSFNNISGALGTLQKCRNLTTLVLTLNFHGEEMPINGVQGFESLKALVIPKCGLSGSIPLWIRTNRELQLLDLSWNALTGAVPSWIGSLDHLFYLDLSNNSLTGEIPIELTKLKSLTYKNMSIEGTSADFPLFIKRNQTARGLQYNQISSFPPSLDLSSNRLTGPIWPEFGILTELHVLELSRNNLSGTIPDKLSTMKSLEMLDLSFNNLTGTIPSSLINLSFLSKFSVANNSLQGSIPMGGQFSTFPDSSFQGNKHLCNGPLSSCQSEIPSTFSRQAGRRKGTIIGIPVGTGMGMAILLVVVFFTMSRTQTKTQCDRETKINTDKSLEDSESRLVVLFQNQDNKELTIGDLLKATNSFDQANIIGCGGFGMVYRATLVDGKKVAIKRLSGDCGQMEREFQAEVEALSRAQHPNLVLLQGYCRFGSDRLLIYSYMENGSLDYWLHEKLDGGSMLDWDTRLRIAQGVARGLSYLHQVCQPHILHRDIKSSNILLDEEFKAHLADFGLARLILPYDTHVTTDLVGTLGYIPPEYSQSSVATFKGDVYSFGVVLLELLTGKRPMDVSKAKGCRDLVSWVRQMKQEKREHEVLDPFVYNKQLDKQMLKVLEVTLLCIDECPKARPFIQQIVSWLDNVGA